jgi:hypothetical protein
VADRGHGSLLSVLGIATIGSYPKNIFLLPLDYYQADVEDIFEKYWNGIQPVVKKNLGMRMWRYVHPANHLRHKINIGKKKSGVSYPHTVLLPAAPLDFDIFMCKIICFIAKNIQHYGLFVLSMLAILSMVTRRISRSAVLPCLTAAEAHNRHFQGLWHSLSTPTFY